LEAYVFTKPTISDREMIKNDFKRHLTRLKPTTLPLGDLREFFAASATPSGS
jgi:hypothetical protein